MWTAVNIQSFSPLKTNLAWICSGLQEEKLRMDKDCNMSGTCDWGGKSQMDYERLDFGAKSSPCICVTSLQTNKNRGGGLMEFIPHTQVPCIPSSSRHSFNGFALEYIRSILEHSRQAFYYFFWVFNFV